MSVEDNLRTTEAHIRAEDARDLDGILATFAEDCVYEDSLLDAPVRGKPAVAAYYRELWAAFPDFRFEVTNRVASDDSVVYEMTFRGTQSGTFRGIPATGRPGELKAVVVFPMANGRALGERVYIDAVSYLTQAGLLPPRESILVRAWFDLVALWLRVLKLLHL